LGKVGKTMTMKVCNFFICNTPLITFFLLVIPCLLVLENKGKVSATVCENDQLSPSYVQSISSSLQNALQFRQKNKCAPINNASLRYLNNGTSELEIDADQPLININNQWVVSRNGHLHEIHEYVHVTHLPYIACAESATPTSRFLQWLLHMPPYILDDYTLTYSHDFYIELQKKTNAHCIIICSCTIPFNEQMMYHCTNIEKQLHRNNPSPVVSIHADVRFENLIIVKKLTKGGHRG
jgi:hypothetical protein